MDETITFEEREYVKPEVSSNEQQQFIDRFRELQAANQAQINQQTYNLGTQTSSNLGGLTGAEGIWNTQYVSPKVNSAIENLQKVRLQTALNTAMANEQNVMANRINQAKRAYNRASAKKSSSGSGSGSSSGSRISASTKGNITTDIIPSGVAADTTVRTNAPGTSVVRNPLSATWENVAQNPIFDVINSANNEVLKTYEATGAPASGSSSSSPTSRWELINPLTYLAPILRYVGAEEKTK